MSGPPAALTRADLDGAVCFECGTEHAHELWVHSRCHPEQGIQAVYADGVLTLYCRMCERLVTRVAVA